MSPLGKFILENCFVSFDRLVIRSSEIYRFYVYNDNIMSFERALGYAEKIGIEIYWS